MTRIAAHRCAILCAAVLAQAGCVSVEVERKTIATAALVRGDGSPAGTARLLRGGTTLLLKVEAFGLVPGQHGLHLHAVGRCEPPDFASAQGHWNPTGRQHGLHSPAGPHAGDVPNLVVGEDGHGDARFRLNEQAGGAGLGGVFDADGTAVVVHAAADDLQTDPSGASGARVACGVLQRS